MSERFMGLDLSYTGTGIVVIGKKKQVLARKLIITAPTDGTDIERCLHIANQVTTLAAYYGVVRVGMEGYAFGKMFGGEKLAELGGIVKGKMHEANIGYLSVPPQSLKVWAIGKGHARDEGKRLMIEAARDGGCATYDDNIADAYHAATWIHAVARYAAAVS